MKIPRKWVRPWMIELTAWGIAFPLNFILSGLPMAWKESIREVRDAIKKFDWSEHPHRRKE